MLSYIVRRILTLIPIILLISFVSFVIIELPPGDYVTARIAQLRRSGVQVDENEIARLTSQYGLDQPFLVRYFRWMQGVLLHGDFGYSFQCNAPVNQVIGERIW